jgi:hypothetical protein
MGKTWKVAQRRSNYQEQQRTNTTVEVFYNSVLFNAKKLHGHSNQPRFERDYRNDRSESGLAMHAFLSDQFYFYLECDLHYDYNIEYAFFRCPFESEIRAMLKGYPCDTRAREANLKPDFPTFYKNVQAFQDKKFFTNQS